VKYLLILVLLLQGCATAPQWTKSPETFAVCKAVDIGSTAYGIHAGMVHEANPIIAGTLAHGYFPLIAISFGIYELLKYLHNDSVNQGANAATCGIAAHNVLLLVK
jgi:hypothetical protein